MLSDVLEQPGRVRPHFQPIVDLQRGEVCGYEALARFTDWPGIPPCDVFAAADGHPVMSLTRTMTLRDRYFLEVHDPALDRRLAIAMAVALDALQSR